MVSWGIVRLGKLFYENLPHVRYKNAEENIKPFLNLMREADESFEKNRGKRAWARLRTHNIQHATHVQNDLKEIESALKKGSSLEEIGISQAELEHLRQGGAHRVQAQRFIEMLRTVIPQSMLTIGEFKRSEYETFEQSTYWLRELLEHIQHGGFDLESIGSSMAEVEQIRLHANLGHVRIGLQELRAFPNPKILLTTNPDDWRTKIREYVRHIPESDLPSDIKDGLNELDTLCKDAWMSDIRASYESAKQTQNIFAISRFKRTLNHLGLTLEFFGITPEELREMEKTGNLQMARERLKEMRKSVLEYAKYSGVIVLHILFDTKLGFAEEIIRDLRTKGKDQLRYLKDYLEKAEANPYKAGALPLELTLFKRLFRSETESP